MRTRRVLVCAPLMPEFDRESGSRRIFHLIELLQASGWSVTFYAENMTEGQRYAHLLQQRGVMVYGGVHSQGIAADAYLPNPRTLLELERFDLAIVAFWYFAEALLPLLRTYTPRTRVLVDSVDLHFLRESRSIFHRKDPASPPPLLGPQFASELVRELNLYASVDGVLTVSQKEADLIDDLLATPHHAHAVPDMEALPPSPVPFKDRNGLLFVGNFRHPPNRQAVRYLFEQIVPLLNPNILEQHPLSVVGNGLTPDVYALGAGVPHVKMIGWVPSIRPYFNQACLSLVPLRYGAGTKRKVIETLQVGTPCIATPIGIEGLGLRHGEHVLVAEDAEAFAASIEALSADEPLWHRLAEQGRAHIMATHSREAVRRALTEALDGVMDKTPRGAQTPTTLAWLSNELAERMQRAKVGVKHVLQTMRIRAQLK